MISYVSLDSTNDDERCFALLATNNHDPLNYSEAINTENRIEWKNAIKDELKSIEENKVWTLVDRPTVTLDGKRANIIDSRWVFKRKVNSEGKTTFKARLVVRGFKDKKEYELRETYAPVSRLSVIRSALAVVNKYDLEVVQLDVKTAFLNGILDGEIYMEIPDGLEVSASNRQNKVCKLEKALYGLKVSPKKWNERFSVEMEKVGLQRDINEPCLFTYRLMGMLIILVLYVDDILLAGNNKSKMQEIIDHLNKVFNMKNLGEPRDYLGMKIVRDRSNKLMTLSQADYIEKVLERFNMSESKPQNTPMITRQVRSRISNDQKLTQTKRVEVPFREVIGSLLYLANVTRPDIAYAVNYLSRKQSDPTEEDWIDAKRILRYLRGTSKLGLNFRGKTEDLEIFNDASFRDYFDSTSTSGMAVLLFGNTVMWRSHKQNIINSSTCHTEYFAMSEACQEAISLDKALRDMLGKTMYPVTLWCDNKSSRDCTQKEGSHKLKSFDDSVEEIKSKLEKREKTGVKVPLSETHGDYVKQCVSEGKIEVRWVSTKDNIADVFTKPLPFDAFNKFRDRLLNL